VNAQMVLELVAQVLRILPFNSDDGFRERSLNFIILGWLSHTSSLHGMRSQRNKSQTGVQLPSTKIPDFNPEYKT
jgi:hypothetical protein